MSTQEVSTTDQSLSRGMESMVLQDADPLQPRGQPDERGDQARPEPEVAAPDPVQDEPITIPMPDPSWRFNSFLVDLADEIDDDELDKLKAMFIEIIGRGVLEKLTTARDLFDHLRKRTHLTIHNLVCLQAMLRKLHRPELIQKAVDYAKTVGNTIHFYEATETLNGYRSVKFHVEGKNFQNCTQNYLFQVRTAVSHWLFVPPERVLISGVEPSSSMLITIMIPEVYADVMEALLKQNEAVQPLSELEIDTVKIGDTAYNITGIEGAELVETEQQSKLVSVYQQLQDKTRQLDSIELALVTLEEEHKILKDKYENIEMEAVTLRDLFYTTKNGANVQPASLSSQAAMTQFKESLAQVKAQNYDKTIIRKLLHANTVVMSNRSRAAYNNQLQDLHLQLRQAKLALQEFASKIAPLQFELMFHRSWSEESGNLETLLRDSLVKLLQNIKVPLQVQEQTLTDYGEELLKTLSFKLRNKEKLKLEKKYKWNPDDHLTKCKNTDHRLFLSVLFYKEIERTQQHVDFDKFVTACLTEVSRQDLLLKFHDMMTKPRQPRQPRPRARTPSGQGAPGEATPKQPAEEQLARLEKQLQSVLEKVSGIENSITSAMNYGQPYDQPFASKFPPTGYGFQTPTVA